MKTDRHINLPETSNIIIPEEIEDLVELLAKNVHETWSRKRLLEGWTYGPARDDQKKEHPCLIDYEDLPESEKDYDRATARETIKFILKSGFSFHKDSSSESN